MMDKSNKVMQCPNHCKDSTFLTAAHVMQEWEVDKNGAFLAVNEGCLQTTHGPDRDNNWRCTKCGAFAREVDLEKEES